MIAQVTSKPTDQKVTAPLAESLKAELMTVTEVLTNWEQITGLILYGYLRGQADLLIAAKAAGKTVYYIDHAYLNPCRNYRRDMNSLSWFRVTLNGMYPKFEQSDGKRLKKMGVEIEPQKPGDVLLFCPASFMMQRNFKGVKMWSRKALRQAREYARQNRLKFLVRVKTDRRPIVWKNIALVATYNSNVVTEAILRGIPYATSAYSAHRAGSQKIGSLFFDGDQDPLDVLAFLADNQYQVRELRLGQVW